MARTEPAGETPPPIVRPPRAWLAPLFFLAGFGLVPWTPYLFSTLPSRHLQAGTTTSPGAVSM